MGDSLNIMLLYLWIWMLLLSNDTRPLAAVRRDPAGGRSSISIGYQYLTSTPSLLRYVSTWTSSFNCKKKQNTRMNKNKWLYSNSSEKEKEKISIVLTESTSSTTPCKPKVFNIPLIANLGSAVPTVPLLVLLLSGQRMTTVRPEKKKMIRRKKSNCIFTSWLQLAVTLLVCVFGPKQRFICDSAFI